jgi:outer membrane protein OmpA-like peptidoglycan-associated protein
LDDSAPPENASVVGGLSDDPSVPERVNFFEAKDFQIRNVAFISLILMVFFIILLYFPDLYQKYEKLFRNARISDVTVQDQVTPSPPLSGQNSKGNDVGFSPKETAENTGLETLNPESETADNSKTIALPIDPKTIQEEEITTKLGGSMPKMAADQGASQSGDLKAETDPSKSAAALIKPLPPLPEEPLRVYFNHNSNELDPGAYEDLANLADHMKQKPEMKVEITGYTDSAGGSSYNKWLSEFRANIVKIFLVGKGINPSRLNAVGKGQENPIASNETAEGRRKNRRVEIILVTLPVPLS